LLVVKSHESFDREETDAKMLAMGDDLMVKNALINFGTGRFILFSS
jgi:hypothetical protein